LYTLSLHDALPISTRAKCTYRRQIALAAIKKIAVQCENHIGAIEFGNHARTSAKRILRGCDCALTQKRLVNTPAHTRKIFFQLCPQTLTRWRIRFFDEKRHAIAVIGEKLIAKVLKVSVEIFALGRFPITDKPFGSGRVVW